jgi:transcription initiation factor TFIIH subunit 1
VRNRFAGMDAAATLDALRKNLGDKPFDIADLIHREVDDEDEPTTTFHRATTQVTEAVRDRSSQLLTPNNNGINSSTGGLPRDVFEQVQSVHATTSEFLRHFWLAFLSGDERRAKDINSMVGSLRKSLERIDAVAQTAEEMREQLRAQRKKELHEEYKRTGIKPKKKDMEVGGGKKVVDEMLAPTKVAIDRAIQKYQAALEEAEKALPTTAAATPTSTGSAA